MLTYDVDGAVTGAMEQDFKQSVLGLVLEPYSRTYGSACRVTVTQGQPPERIGG